MLPIMLANTAVRNNKDYSLYQNEAVYPSVMPAGQYFENLAQNILELQSDLWTNVKSGNLSVDSKLNNRKIYIESAALAGIIVVVAAVKIITTIRKRKIEDLSDLYEK